MRVSSNSDLSPGRIREIAVIIPFRGELDELSAAVNSVRKSTFANYRILVIDDRSGNVSRPSFLAEDEYFQGFGQGLPNAIELSKGHVSEEYVALLAGDDLMSPQRLQKQMERIKRDDSQICLSKMRKFSSHHPSIEMLSGEPEIETFTLVWLLLGAYGADGTALMTSEFFKEKYVLDPSDSYSDWVLALRDYPTKISFVPEDLVFYRQHANQTTRNNRNPFLSSGVYGAWTRVFEEYFQGTPSEEVFLILSSPWFRTRIRISSILISRKYATQLIKFFQEGPFSKAEIDSAEKIVLRRYIFRISPRTVIPILIVIGKIGIIHPYRRMSLECYKIAESRLSQRGIKPRRVRR